jgi:transcription regulator MmyB-like protein
LGRAASVWCDNRLTPAFVDDCESARSVGITTGARPKRAAGRSCSARPQSDLVGELATRSEEFRGLWAAQNVRLHTQGVKRFNHPVVGELELSFNQLEVAADPGLMLVAYTTEPGSRSAEAFELLAGWAATEEAGGAARSDPGHAGRDGR